MRYTVFIVFLCLLPSVGCGDSARKNVVGPAATTIDARFPGMWMVESVVSHTNGTNLFSSVRPGDAFVLSEDTNWYLKHWSTRVINYRGKWSTIDGAFILVSNKDVINIPGIQALSGPYSFAGNRLTITFRDRAVLSELQIAMVMSRQEVDAGTLAISGNWELISVIVTAPDSTTVYDDTGGVALSGALVFYLDNTVIGQFRYGGTLTSQSGTYTVSDSYVTIGWNDGSVETTYFGPRVLAFTDIDPEAQSQTVRTYRVWAGGVRR